MAEDLKEIMAKEKLSRADFLGFSDGANLAMMFAKKYPDSVNRLVLNSGNTTTDGLNKIAIFLFHLVENWDSFLGFFSKRYKQKGQITDLITRNIGVSKADLTKIKNPTLVIVGQRDVIKLSHSRYIAKTIPNSKYVVIPKNGHTLARTDPVSFNTEVLKFLI